MWYEYDNFVMMSYGAFKPRLVWTNGAWERREVNLRHRLELHRQEHRDSEQPALSGVRDAREALLAAEQALRPKDGLGITAMER